MVAIDPQVGELQPHDAAPADSDDALVRAAQAGSIDAFTRLYERHRAGVRNHCRNRLGNWDDAEDAAQEAFLRAWRNLPAFGGDRRFYPWLKTIATNVCIDAVRKRGRAVPVVPAPADGTVIDIAAPVGDGADDLLVGRFQVSEVAEVLARLPERQRDILVLREYEGWTYERIAAHEQLDLSAVKSVLWRARQGLKRELEKVGASAGQLVGLLLPVRLLRRGFTGARHAALELAATAGRVGADGSLSAAATTGRATVVAAAALAVPAIVVPAVQQSAPRPVPVAAAPAPTSTALPAPVPHPQVKAAVATRPASETPSATTTSTTAPGAAATADEPAADATTTTTSTPPVEIVVVAQPADPTTAWPFDAARRHERSRTPETTVPEPARTTGHDRQRAPEATSTTSTTTEPERRRGGDRDHDRSASTTSTTVPVTTTVARTTADTTQPPVDGSADDSRRPRRDRADVSPGRPRSGRRG